MAQISSYIAAPYQGVSQAPPQVRPTSMAEAIEDAMVAIPQGATKRPPFSWQARLASHPGHTNGLFETIEREGDQDVFLSLTNEGGVIVPRVWRMDGLPRGYEPGGYVGEAISIEAGAQAYLNSGSPTPNEDLSILTVEDYTFIVNRKVIVSRQFTSGAPTRTPDRDPEAMLWIRQSAYARTYSVTVNPGGGTPVTVTLKTPNGKDATDGDFVDTDAIAKGLLTGVYATGNPNGATISGDLNSLISQGFTISRIGGVIYLSSPAEFTVAVEDGQGGSALLAIKDKVQRFSDLPVKSVDGFTVRITQQSGSDEDDFFVKYVETAGTGTGVWEETIAPNAELGLDPKTMPVGLVNDGGWQLKILDWKPRQTGDENLAPDPDFIGQAVQDLSFWRGRLAVISGEGITLSAAGDPFREYPKTLSSVLDDDPVGLINPYPNKSVLRYGIPFDEKLVGFGDIAQVQVTSDGTLTPNSADIDILTTYEFSARTRPQSSNGKLYFVAPHGSSSSTVYEMKVRRIGDVADDPEDMTIAVPRYVPGGVDRVANCPVNYLMVYGRSGTAQLYIHLFRYADGQRVQNAWQRWNLPEGFVLGGMWFRNTRMYLLACRDGEAHLAMADLAPDLLDDEPSARILTHLDFRLTEGQVGLYYDRDTDRTTVTLPFSYSDQVRVVSRAPGGVGGPRYTLDGPGPAPEGFPADINAAATAAAQPNQVVLIGDWTQCPLWIGFQYSMRIRLSRFYALGQDSQPIRSGRLSLRRLALDIADTGYLRVEVTAKGRGTRSYAFEGYRLDDPDSVYNQVPAATTVFRVPLMGENEQITIDLINDSHFPSKVLGYEWRGELNQKATRIT